MCWSSHCHDFSFSNTYPLNCSLIDLRLEAIEKRLEEKQK